MGGIGLEIQWYPGHMEKAKRLLIEHLKQVNVVIELLDARIPYSSKNPLIDSLISGKPRILAMNKCDLADASVNTLWCKWYENQGYECVLINSLTGDGLKNLLEKIRNITRDKAESMHKRGIRNFRIKSMVVGIPNVGKSTFINRIAGRSAAKTGDKPGITRGKQWIRLAKDIDLLDTPGILWPKFQDKTVGLNLAAAYAISDTVADIEEIASYLLLFLDNNYPESIIQRYRLKDEMTDGYALLEEVGRNRGCLKAGNEVDTYRAAAMILDEFRNGILGRISLEKPDDFNVKTGD
jgi:ribosome biogenesis GTPase A